MRRKLTISFPGAAPPLTYITIKEIAALAEYLRDLDDYRELCVSCHKKFDLRRLAGV